MKWWGITISRNSLLSCHTYINVQQNIREIFSEIFFVKRSLGLSTEEQIECLFFEIFEKWIKGSITSFRKSRPPLKIKLAFICKTEFDKSDSNNNKKRRSHNLLQVKWKNWIKLLISNPVKFIPNILRMSESGSDHMDWKGILPKKLNNNSQLFQRKFR